MFLKNIYVIWDDGFVISRAEAVISSIEVVDLCDFARLSSLSIWNICNLSHFLLGHAFLIFRVMREETGYWLTAPQGRRKTSAVSYQVAEQIIISKWDGWWGGCPEVSQVAAGNFCGFVFWICFPVLQQEKCIICTSQSHDNWFLGQKWSR